MLVFNSSDNQELSKKYFFAAKNTSLTGLEDGLCVGPRKEAKGSVEEAPVMMRCCA